MKRVIVYLLLMVEIGLISSCRTSPDYLLTGNIAEIESQKPVCIFWYQPGETGWEVNKSWSSPGDIQEIDSIAELLANADKNLVYTEGEYKLSLIYYNGCPKDLALWEVKFTLVGNSFSGSVGSSNELGELLSRYKPEQKPLVMPSMDPDRIKEIQKGLRLEAERRKKERSVYD